MDGKLGDDVCEEEVPMVLSRWVYTLLGKETWPGKGHQTTKLGSLTLVVGVVNVRGSVFHQEGGELKEKDAD